MESCVFSFFLTGWVVWGLGYGWMGNVLIYGVSRGNGPEKDSIVLPQLHRVSVHVLVIFGPDRPADVVGARPGAEAAEDWGGSRVS